MDRSAQTPKNILVVDDEPLVSESVRMVLALDGHKAETARNAEEALVKFNKDHYDIIVTDFTMPGMKGDELARNIKGLAPTRPVILLTAYPPRQLPPEIDVLVIKPFDLDSLRQGLASATET